MINEINCSNNEKYFLKELLLEYRIKSYYEKVCKIYKNMDSAIITTIWNLKHKYNIELNALEIINALENYKELDIHYMTSKNLLEPHLSTKEEKENIYRHYIGFDIPNICSPNKIYNQEDAINRLSSSLFYFKYIENLTKLDFYESLTHSLDIIREHAYRMTFDDISTGLKQFIEKEKQYLTKKV